MNYEEVVLENSVGQYSLKDLVKTIKTISPFDEENNSISIELDKNKSRVKVKCVFDLQFGKWGPIGELLGFTEHKVLKANEYHCGDAIPKFIPLNTLKLHCNIADGMIVRHDDHNHRETSIIATFKPRTIFGFGDTIHYEPAYPLFFPMQTDRVNEVVIEIKDDKGKLK